MGSPPTDLEHGTSDQRNARLVLATPRRSRRLLFIAAVVVLVPLCYQLAALRMEWENERDILLLDLEVAPHFKKGAKTVNKWGVLRRDAVQVTCSGGAPGMPAVDWSNSETCMGNAVLHTNCVPICDASFSSCDGCDVLQEDHDLQLTTAQGRCATRSSTVCTLEVKSNGKYDYVGLSSCCLNTLPFGPQACLCQNQLSSAPWCYALGSCLAECATSSLRTTCPGTVATIPTPPLTCVNPLAATCSSTFAGTDLTCKSGKYLVLETSTCVTICPAGSYPSEGKTCLACSGTNVATCSGSTTPLTCTSGFYLSGASCENSCGANTATCNDGSDSLTCVPGSYLWNSEGFPPDSAPSSCVTDCGSEVGVDGMCTPCPSGYYGVNNVCSPCAPFNAATCNSPTNAVTCLPGFVYSVDASGDHTTCSTSCPAPTSSTGYVTVGGPYFTTAYGGALCVPQPIPGTLDHYITLNGASSCSAVSGSGQQYYLNQATSECGTISYCNIYNTGTITTDSSGTDYGTCTSCYDANASHCSSTAAGDALTCAAVYNSASLIQYYLNAAGACVLWWDCPNGSDTKTITLPGSGIQAILSYCV